jgi:hypothetical protein
MAKSTITLASGKEMPLVGFGLWKVPKETAADTVYNVSISRLDKYILLSALYAYTVLTGKRPSKQDTDSLTAPTTTKTKKKPDKESNVPSPRA